MLISTNRIFKQLTQCRKSAVYHKVTRMFLKDSRAHDRTNMIQNDAKIRSVLSPSLVSPATRLINPETSAIPAVIRAGHNKMIPFRENLRSNSVKGRTNN